MPLLEIPENLKVLRVFGPLVGWVLDVPDGDTVVVLLELPYDNMDRIRVRLKGINAPEKNSRVPERRERGQAAWAQLQELLPFGTPVLVRADKPRKSFERWVADLLLADGRDVATVMLASGLVDPFAAGDKWER